MEEHGHGELGCKTKKVTSIFTYDTLNNPKSEDSSEWMRLNLPFINQCCLKVLDMTLSYPEGAVTDKMCGFFSVQNSKNYSTKLNLNGQCEVVVNNEILRNPSIVHSPLSMPGTEKPKILAPIKLNIIANQEEIKFCISNEKREPVPLARGVFIFEIVREEKDLTF